MLLTRITPAPWALRWSPLDYHFVGVSLGLRNLKGDSKGEGHGMLYVRLSMFLQGQFVALRGPWMWLVLGLRPGSETGGDASLLVATYAFLRYRKKRGAVKFSSCAAFEKIPVVL